MCVEGRRGYESYYFSCMTIRVTQHTFKILNNNSTFSLLQGVSVMFGHISEVIWPKIKEICPIKLCPNIYFFKCPPIAFLINNVYP